MSVFSKAGSADAEQVYSLGKPCPVDITSTSTQSAGTGVRVEAAITGAVLGGCFLIVLVALAAWYGVRRLRQRRARGMDQELWGSQPHKAFSLDDKVSSHFLFLPASAAPLLFLLQLPGEIARFKCEPWSIFVDGQRPRWWAV